MQQIEVLYNDIQASIPQLSISINWPNLSKIKTFVLTVAPFAPAVYYFYQCFKVKSIKPLEQPKKPLLPQKDETIKKTNSTENLNSFIVESFKFAFRGGFEEAINLLKDKSDPQVKDQLAFIEDLEKLGRLCNGLGLVNSLTPRPSQFKSVAKGKWLKLMQQYNDKINKSSDLTTSFKDFETAIKIGLNRGWFNEKDYASYSNLLEHVKKYDYARHIESPIKNFLFYDQLTTIYFMLGKNELANDARIKRNTHFEVIEKSSDISLEDFLKLAEYLIKERHKTHLEEVCGFIYEKLETCPADQFGQAVERLSSFHPNPDAVLREVEKIRANRPELQDEKLYMPKTNDKMELEYTDIPQDETPPSKEEKDLFRLHLIQGIFCTIIAAAALITHSIYPLAGIVVIPILPRLF